MGASVTLWEATAPVKLPPWHGPPSCFKEWCSNGVSPDGTCGESGISPLPPPSPRAQVHRLPPILRTSHTPPMPGCSKAPRGLFVLSRATSIFTGSSISPGPLLRQRSSRYSIRAGRNLPDKEFRYLRTVIVTAAVYWGFGSPPCDSSPSPSSTGQESAPILRLTASQRPVFLVNSRLSPFAATPSGLPARGRSPSWGSPFSRSYGVSLPSSLTEVLPFTCRVFSAPTCVGLRYGRATLSLEAFRGGPGTRDSILPSENLALPLPCPHQARAGGFASPRWATKAHAACPIAALTVPLRVPPSVKRSSRGTGILDQLSIAYALRPRLRPA